MDRLPVDVIRPILDHLHDGYATRPERYWRRYFPFGWYAAISPRWQEAVEERSIPRRLFFQSKNFEQFRYFFRYPHRRANLRHIDYTISPILETERTEEKALKNWILAGGHPLASSSGPVDPVALNFVAQLRLLFAELCTWSTGPGMSIKQLELSIHAYYWDLDCYKVDSASVEQLCLLCRSLSPPPYIHVLSLIVPDLPPMLAYELVRRLPNIEKLTLQFGMPRNLHDGDLIAFGVKHCESVAKGLESLNIPSLKHFSFTYDIRPGIWKHETMLRALTQLSRAVAQFAQCQPLESLHVYGPFDHFQTPGLAATKSKQFLEDNKSAFDTPLWAHLKHASLTTFEPDYLSSLKQLDAGAAYTLLSCRRPQRLEKWPSAFLNSADPDPALCRLRERYLRLDERQRDYLDAVVPSLAAFHATLAEMPRVEEVSFSDAVRVREYVLYLRLCISPTRPAFRQNSWRPAGVRIMGYIFTWYKEETELAWLKELAGMLWSFWTRRPDEIRRLMQDGGGRVSA